ncbi:MAG TPA: phosphoribosyl-AMP cyclohydrolase, partial [Candidatus Dormibacteraeota bacterium]|nr:phosphoribosyl-AMP cyclohydrolase [Candidatus Dormibacteraeota bacterium]
VDRRRETRAGRQGFGDQAVKPDFSKGLVPAVVQDADSGKVLMLAYMDEESWTRTRESGQAWFHSRERGLWRKGETSGNTMEVIEVRLDCDVDAVLMRVKPAGPACHTGAESCFFNEP